MSDSVDAIDSKKKETADGKDAPKESDWGAFFISVLQYAGMLALFALIGANFIFFTSSDKLEVFFPTDPSKYYADDLVKAPGPMKGGRKQRGGAYNCFPSGEKGKGLNMSALSSLGLGKKFEGWPYSLHKNNESGFSLDSWKNWFATTLGDSYMAERDMLQSFFKFFAPAKPGEDSNMFANQSFQMLFGNLLIHIVAIISFLVGLGTVSYKAFTNKFWGWQWGLIGLFVGYTWMMMFATPIVQTVQLMLTLMFLPLLVDRGMVGKIIHCNQTMLSMLFGLLVVGAGLQYLDFTTSTVMMIAYLILVIKNLFF